MDTRRVIVERGGAKRRGKWYFSEIGAEFRRAGIGIGRPLPIAILIDPVPYCRRHWARLIRDSSSKRSYFSQRLIEYTYTYVSRFEVNFILLFNRMKYVLSSRTDVEERRLSRFQILSTRVIKLHTGSTMGRERSIRKREKKNFLLERNVFFLRRSSSPFLLARFINNDDPIR